ncbi:MAG: MBL fold metallo-hydrolase [Thermoplasmata archaeon]|nr:MAG: MBL fold metallo-hydrolase [Thermoplasmata archaeon]
MTIFPEAYNIPKNPDKFGPVRYLWGKNDGRFPYDNAIFIDDEIKVIIDPGSNPKTLKKINSSNKIDYVFNSHYHYDHIRFNYIFPDSKIMMHERDAVLFGSLDKIAQAIGLGYLYDQEAVEQWKSQLKGGPAYFRGMYDVAYGNEWVKSTERVDGIIKDGAVFGFGECTMEVIHTPGHSLGMCCFVFPQQSAAYVTDYDLTPFGPWYGSLHCDLDALIHSAGKLKNLQDIDWFITSHEMGVFNRSDFLAGLDKFMAIIDERDEKIIEVLKTGPIPLTDLVKRSIVYHARHVEDKFTYLWEWLHLERHLERLIKAGRIEEDGGEYRVL